MENTRENLGNIPPNNIDAEKSVLGCMLLVENDDAVSNAIDSLKPEDFYVPAHKAIFGAVRNLWTSRVPVDIISLTEELKKTDKLEKIGGVPYLSSLVEIVPSASNNKYYIDIVKEKSLLRQLINASTTISSMAFNEDDNAQNIIDKSESLIYNISNSNSSENFKPVQPLLMGMYDWIDERTKHKGTPPGLNTGFRDLDNITGGLQKGELIILAARPSMGKTALAMNIALNSALRSKATVAVFSLEMGAESLTKRMVASEAKADMQTFKKGNFEQTELDKIVKACANIHNTSMFIDDTTIITPINMLSKCRKLKSEQGKLDLIVVDYLQMVSSPQDYKDNRVLEISMISRGLKTLAREMDCPVISLAQLSRAVENRPDKRPMLSDLRESGAIEADADIVLMLYRPKYYEKKELIANTPEDEVPAEPQEDDENEIAELIVAKHRNGPTGTINLNFVSKYVSFYGVETMVREN